ncbi:MAG TPA: serpin family protein, partial [Symbiobacteriaceae bacterium]|nr:serpin family protein [Symbiobacteriaceae bacterium]
MTQGSPLAILLLILLVGCGGVAKPAGTESLTGPKEPVTTTDARLMRAETSFSFDLLGRLQAEKPGQNLFISPASVSLALAMTYNGARGETQQAMAEALAVDGMTVAEVNQANAALQSVLSNPDPKVELSIANSIWYQQGYKVNPGFLAATGDFYKAEVAPVDFASPTAGPTINRWVSDATRGKIPKVIGETDPLDRMYLVNAIYFNGKWKEPFDEKLTQPRPFFKQDGSSKEHPMMTKDDRFRYLQGDNFQAVALPYGDGRLNMYVFLPDKGVTLDQFAGSITADRWEAWMGQFRSKEGVLTLPKVKLEWESNLKQAMTDLGMGIAFQPGKADFGDLFAGMQEELYIGFILHKTFLDMNEKGTEAAAVTVVGIRATSMPAPQERFTMLVDRPYLMAIRDDKTGA